MPAVVNGVHHIALRCTNLRESVNFYTRALGFSPFASWGEGAEKIVMLSMGEQGILEMFAGGHKGEKEPEERAGSFFHLALEVPSADEAYTKCIAQGAKSKIPPTDMDIPANPVMPVRIAFVYGPDGETLEFFQKRDK